MKLSMKSILALAVVAAIGLMGAGAALGATTDFPDQSLTGGSQTGHFDEVFDLTAGDIALSFTYDANGLVDDAGAHAWAELGVRSAAEPYPDFNPYWRQTGVGGPYSYAGSVRLLAGQNIDVGDVTVTSDATHLYVTYHVDAGWCMEESHFAVATQPSDLPQTKKGNAIPGRFLFGESYSPCETGDVALPPIALADIEGFAEGAALYFAAHAAVRSDTGSESAWGEGVGFPGKNWSMYFGIEAVGEPIYTAGSGVWLASDYDWTPGTFDPDVTPNLDLDDKLMLQREGGHGEGDYDLPSVPPVPGNNHRFWWDRDGVDPWQNPATANTGGLYEIVITLHADSPTTGTAHMSINGLDQGFEVDGNWSTIELTPAGMSFTGDMQNLQVFYGLYGYGATHSVAFRDIAVTQ